MNGVYEGGLIPVFVKGKQSMNLSRFFDPSFPLNYLPQPPPPFPFDPWIIKYCQVYNMLLPLNRSIPPPACSFPTQVTAKQKNIRNYWNQNLKSIKAEPEQPGRLRPLNLLKFKVFSHNRNNSAIKNAVIVFKHNKFIPHTYKTSQIQIILHNINTPFFFFPL